MADLDDVELAKSAAEQEDPDLQEPQPPEPGFRVGTILCVALALAAAGGIGYLLLRKPAAPASPTPPPTNVVATTPTPPALAVPLDESDGLVRELLRGLSTHPQVALWLGTSGLVRTFVVTVENVTEGQSPAPILRFLAPKQPLAVTRKGSAWVLDPRSYARYDAFAAGIASLDAAVCATAYGQLEPYFEAAYRELGHPEGGFAAALGRAVAHLQATPVATNDLEVKQVRRATLVYEITDPRLEGLSLAQKHLLRMGPANTRKIQAKLAELTAATGLALRD